MFLLRSKIKSMFMKTLKTTNSMHLLIQHTPILTNLGFNLMILRYIFIAVIQQN